MPPLFWSDFFAAQTVLLAALLPNSPTCARSFLVSSPAALENLLYYSFCRLSSTDFSVNLSLSPVASAAMISRFVFRMERSMYLCR